MLKNLRSKCIGLLSLMQHNYCGYVNCLISRFFFGLLDAQCVDKINQQHLSTTDFPYSTVSNMFTAYGFLIFLLYYMLITYELIFFGLKHNTRLKQLPFGEDFKI